MGVLFCLLKRVRELQIYRAVVSNSDKWGDQILSLKDAELTLFFIVEQNLRSFSKSWKRRSVLCAGVNDRPEELCPLSWSDLRAAKGDPDILLVYSNDQSAGRGSDSADASNFLQHMLPLELPLLLSPSSNRQLVGIDFLCIIPRWLILSLGESGSVRKCFTLGDACQGGRSRLGLEAQNSCLLVVGGKDL